jgi:hypothetical protein
MEPHIVSTKVPVDTPVGGEMVIFRSSRGARLHDPPKVQVGQRVILQGQGHAEGEVLSVQPHVPFRDIHDADIRDSYYEETRTRESLLRCLQGMYAESGYDEDTPTTVIRCRRTA